MKVSSDRDKLRKEKPGFTHCLWHLLGWAALIAAVFSTTMGIVSAPLHMAFTVICGFAGVASWNVWTQAALLSADTFPFCCCFLSGIFLIFLPLTPQTCLLKVHCLWIWGPRISPLLSPFKPLCVPCSFLPFVDRWGPAVHSGDLFLFFCCL